MLDSANASAPMPAPTPSVTSISTPSLTASKPCSLPHPIASSPMLHLLINADVHAPEHLGRRHLLVGGGSILWMGTEQPQLTGLDIEVTDLNGWRVLPGFVDGHAHLTGGGGEAGPQTKVPPPPLSDYTRAGVTTVVGVLGTDDLTRTTSELVARVR